MRFLCLFWIGSFGLLFPLSPLSSEPATQASSKPSGLSRQAAIQHVLTQNPTLRAEIAKIQIAEGRLRGLRAFPTNPEIEPVGKFKVKPPKEPFEPSKLEVEMTWKMPIGGRWGRIQEAADAFLQRTKAEVEAKRFHLVFKLHRTYNKLLIAREEVALQQQTVDFFTSVLKQTEITLQEGAATRLDVNFVRLELLQAQAAAVDARASEALARQELATLLGFSDPALVSDLSDLLPLRWPSPGSLPSLQQQARQKHVRLLVLQNEIKEAQALLAFARSKAIPDLKLKLFYSIEADTIHTIGAGFQLPIPFFWREQDKIEETHAKIRQIRLKFQAEIFNVDQALQKAFIRYQQALRVFEVYQTQFLPIAQQQLRLQIRSLRLGQLQLLQLVTTQKAVLKGLSDRLKALKRVADSYIALQEAAGVLPSF